MSLLNFNFVMIYIIHKMLALLKNYRNHYRHSIFKCFFKEYNRLLLCFFLNFFSQHIMMESLSNKKEEKLKI